MALGDESWESKRAFIFVAAGAMIGLGNIFRFSYAVSAHGGVFFLFVYFLMLMTLGVCSLLAQLTLGQRTQSGVLEATKKIGRVPYFFGKSIFLACFFILSTYSIIGGWTIAYVKKGWNGEFNHYEKVSMLDTAALRYGANLEKYFLIIFWEDLEEEEKGYRLRKEIAKKEIVNNFLEIDRYYLEHFIEFTRIKIQEYGSQEVFQEAFVSNSEILNELYTFVEKRVLYQTSREVFVNFLHSPRQLVGYQIIFLIFSAVFVMFGINKGMGKLLKYLIPVFFLILSILCIYVFLFEDIVSGLKPVLSVNFEALNLWKVLDEALLQVFYTLSIGVGGLLLYASHLKIKSRYAVNAILWVLFLDTLASLMAGLFVFSIVRSVGFEVVPGIDFMFVILPVAFSSSPINSVMGTLFFIMIFLASLTSSIALLNIIVRSFRDFWSSHRQEDHFAATSFAVILLILLGIPCILSLSTNYFTFFGIKFIHWMNGISGNIFVTLGAIGIFITVGYYYREEVFKVLRLSGDSGDQKNIFFEKVLSFFWRIVCPLGIILIVSGRIVRFVLARFFS